MAGRSDAGGRVGLLIQYNKKGRLLRGMINVFEASHRTDTKRVITTVERRDCSHYLFFSLYFSSSSLSFALSFSCILVFHASYK